MFVDYVGVNRIKSGHGLGEVFLGYFRAQKDMTGVDSVATLFDKLYDMEAILGLNYFGDFLRIVEVECHSRIFGHKLPAAHETDFAATHGLGGFGI